MIAFHIVLRNNAVVLDSGFIQEVCGVGLLKKSITDVFFISKNLVDGAGPPFCFASAGENAVSLRPPEPKPETDVPQSGNGPGVQAAEGELPDLNEISDSGKSRQRADIAYEEPLAQPE